MPTHEPRLTGTKVCKTCGLPKPVIAFAVEKKATDGLQSICRECKRQSNKQTPGELRRKAKVLEGRAAGGAFTQSKLNQWLNRSLHGSLRNNDGEAP